jgi:hypothetical protein
MSKYDDAPEERARVRSRIVPFIMAFRVKYAGRHFHMEDLRRFVLREVPTTAPDSPGRILRELRSDGRLDYVVLNRRQSLYQFRARRNT